MTLEATAANGSLATTNAVAAWRQRHHALLRFILLALSGVVVAAVICTAGWFILTDVPLRSSEAIEFVIPDGTAALVARGSWPPTLPANLTFVAGDTFVMRNNDVVEHNLGPYLLPAKGEVRVVMDTPRSSPFLCTVHPRGALDVIVQGKPHPIIILWATLASGLPLGLTFAAVVTLMSRV